MKVNIRISGTDKGADEGTHTYLHLLNKPVITFFQGGVTLLHTLPSSEQPCKQSYSPDQRFDSSLDHYKQRNLVLEAFAIIKTFDNYLIFQETATGYSPLHTLVRYSDAEPLRSDTVLKKSLERLLDEQYFSCQKYIPSGTCLTANKSDISDTSASVATMLPTDWEQGILRLYGLVYLYKNKADVQEMISVRSLSLAYLPLDELISSSYDRFDTLTQQILPSVVTSFKR